MPETKPDAVAIVALLEHLTKEPWLVDPEQRNWPEYSFHFADIENAVGILRKGQLFSRRSALEQGVLVNDHASGEIIEQTDPQWQEYVRLYFRPRTPTFYDNEGFRPVGELRYPDAHCRIPVAFLFDAAQLLTTQGVLFSDGSLARKESRIGGDAEFLQSLPFEQIYHDRAIQADEDKTEIVRRRHAEIMVPNALPLEGFLRWIFLRSEAEMQTLFSLLEDSGIRLSDSWTSRIRVARPGNLFYRRWTYVERVAVTRSEIRIDFNPDTLTPGPFRVDIQFLEQNSLALMASWGQEGFFAQGARAIAVPSPVAGGSALFRALLDRHLAYQNRIDLRSDAFVF